jgi:hypothetical protein
MVFPHNGKIITIYQLTHYEPNHFDNIDNILPLVRTRSYAFSFIDIGPRIFKDPSLIGAYLKVPPLLHPSTQFCVVYSNGINIEANTPPMKEPPHIKVPLVGELLPQEFLEKPTVPLIPDPPPLQGKILVWETIPQSITQIPFFYRPPRVEVFQVVGTVPFPTWFLPSMYGIYTHP